MPEPQSRSRPNAALRAAGGRAAFQAALFGSVSVNFRASLCAASGAFRGDPRRKIRATATFQPTKKARAERKCALALPHHLPLFNFRPRKSGRTFFVRPTPPLTRNCTAPPSQGCPVSLRSTSLAPRRSHPPVTCRDKNSFRTGCAPLALGGA